MEPRQSRILWPKRALPLSKHAPRINTTIISIPIAYQYQYHTKIISISYQYQYQYQYQRQYRYRYHSLSDLILQGMPETLTDPFRGTVRFRGRCKIMGDKHRAEFRASAPTPTLTAGLRAQEGGVCRLRGCVTLTAPRFPRPTVLKAPCACAKACVRIYVIVVESII